MTVGDVEDVDVPVGATEERIADGFGVDPLAVISHDSALSDIVDSAGEPDFNFTQFSSLDISHRQIEVDGKGEHIVGRRSDGVSGVVIDGIGGGVLVDVDERWVLGENAIRWLIESSTVL